MISKWPEYSEARNFASEEKAIEIIKEAVRGIRNVRTEMNVAPSKKAHVYVVSEKEDCSSQHFPMLLMYLFRQIRMELLMMQYP